MEGRVIYFEKSGPANTDVVLRTALKRAEELGIEHVVVATGGETLRKTVNLLAAQKLPLQAIGVTLQAGTWATYGEPQWDILRACEAQGAKVLTVTHGLMGTVESAIVKKFGGLPPMELIAHTYYTFSQGTKVAVEIVLSAVDAGLIPAGVDVVSIAGTGQGADTALVMKAVSSVDFFDLKIRELLCMPR